MESDPRYPIGLFRAPQPYTAEIHHRHLDQLAGLPAQMRAAVLDLDDAQLDTPYRDGGWTVRQVVHHVPDSHANAYIRHKLAVTEENPTIRGYDERRWAELGDARSGEVETPLRMLEAVHARWVAFLRTLSAAQLRRTFVHPETGKTWTLEESLAMYAWHGRHHVAQVAQLRGRRGW
jgi:uncharacterized damage-inducible protein DinB